LWSWQSSPPPSDFDFHRGDNNGTSTHCTTDISFARRRRRQPCVMRRHSTGPYRAVCVCDTDIPLRLRLLLLLLLLR